MAVPTLENGAEETCPLKLFWSPSSPGSISVAMLLFVTKTPFVSVCFMFDEYKSDERYWKLNPDRTVPTFQDTAHGLTLTTPNAILKYLATSRPELASYLSKDLKKRSVILSALDWDLFVLRKTERDLTLSIEFKRPQLTDDYWGTNSGNGGAHTSKPNGVLSSIARIESIWLRKGRFSCGSKTPNISDFALWADFSFLVNVFKLWSIFTVEKYPGLLAWDQKMKGLFNENESARELLKTWETRLNQMAELKPSMPSRPNDLDLPWKDYKE